MKAVRIHETGGPEVLGVEEVGVPAPGPDELLIRVGAAGVNFTDVMARQGVYLSPGAAPELPAILGTEVAGVVAAAGPGAPGELVGRRVIAFVRGGYAEYAIALPALVTELPPGVDLAEATAFLVQGVTAWQLLRDCGRVRPGESVLVHAAAGGVGTLAVQLAKLWGAGRVIATASSEEKRALALELGADAAVDTTPEGLCHRLREANGGAKVDVVLEMAGGPAFTESFRALGRFGRLVAYGNASREVVSITNTDIQQHSRAVIGYWLVDCLADPAGMIAAPLASLFELVQAGELKPIVGGTYPLAEAARAHRELEARKTTGKLVLDPVAS
jgi:NADPH2:quinone reductase